MLKIEQVNQGFTHIVCDYSIYQKHPSLIRDFSKVRLFLNNMNKHDFHHLEVKSFPFSVKEIIFTFKQNTIIHNDEIKNHNVCEIWRKIGMKVFFVTITE
jgi:hypothetical protein